jgi:hypothetical protein
MPEESKELDENARREFLTKAVSAAGALAAAGLAADLLSTGAEAQGGAGVIGSVRPRAAVASKTDVGRVPLKYQKLQNGHSIEVTSTELTNILAREGLISQDLAGKESLLKLMILCTP